MKLQHFEHALQRQHLVHAPAIAGATSMDIEGRIANIDVVGTVPHARVEAENWTGHKFTGLFLLIKLDDKWKIINKVFHLH